MSRMAQQSQRFVTLIKQQLQVLTEERHNVIETIEHATNQIISEVDTWCNEGNFNHTTYAEMNRRVQDFINFFMAKSSEISNLEIRVNDSHINLSSSATDKDLLIPKAECKSQEDKEQSTFKRDEMLNESGVIVGSSSSQSMTMGVTTVEETLLSLKRTMEQLQEKQEHFEKTLKDNGTQQENFNKEIEILTNSNLKSQKKLKERLKEVEKTSLESSATVDNLHKVFSVDFDAKVTRLEEENKSVNASMNEFNKQIISLRSCSNDVIMSTQDLSKRVESTDQHYNEFSDKLNQLEISLNLLSSQYTEQLEHVCSVNKEKIDDSIGTLCQLLAKRLNSLEKLNETLNKKLNGRKKLSQVDDVEIRLANLADVVKEIELKNSHPNVGFLAQGICDVTNTRGVISLSSSSISKYGDHFDPSTGTFTAPLKGFYLISLSTSKTKANEMFVVQCFLRKTTKTEECPCMDIYSVTKIQSVTRCIELEAGYKLYLEAFTLAGNIKLSVRIGFSCYLIKA